MVRVIEGRIITKLTEGKQIRIITKLTEGKQKLLRASERFELSGFDLQRVKLQ